MNEITSINSALIDGGVTDGKRTVFYRDVKSVSVSTNRSLASRITLIIDYLFVAAGIVMVLSSIFGESPSIWQALVGVAAIVIFGAAAWIETSKSETGVKAFTHNGAVTLRYRQFSPSDPDIGKEVASILSLRRGQPASLETKDCELHFWNLKTSDDSGNVDSEDLEPEPRLFTIENDLLTIFDKYPQSDNVMAIVDLTNVVRVENKYRKHFFNKGQGLHEYHNDLAFEFRSGQKSIHYISFFSSLEAPSPAYELCEGISSYLRSRQSLGARTFSPQ